MLVPATDQLQGDSPASAISLTASTSTQLVGVDAGQASEDGSPGNFQHNGVQITADSANTSAIYILLGTGVASATNWHLVLPAGSSWPGTVGGVVWRGAVQGWTSASAKVGVAVV